jgi:hypothetical protein
MQVVEQELLTLPEHPSSSPVFSGVPVTRSLVLCVCFVDRCLFFCPFVCFYVFSVLLRFMDSDYPFDIIKLFFNDLNVLRTYKEQHWIISRYDKVPYLKPCIRSLWHVYTNVDEIQLKWPPFGHLDFLKI